MFTIPSLPKDWYFKLREWGATLDLSPWQMVILGLWCIAEVGGPYPERLQELAKQVKESLPKP